MVNNFNGQKQIKFLWLKDFRLYVYCERSISISRRQSLNNIGWRVEGTQLAPLHPPCREKEREREKTRSCILFPSHFDLRRGNSTDVTQSEAAVLVFSAADDCERRINYLEHVELKATIEHPVRGRLEIFLTSPAGLPQQNSLHK